MPWGGSRATIRCMRGVSPVLVDRLADGRSRKVVFVSHCLLNENARYLGGAFHPGAVPEIAGLLDAGIGIHQLPCPEVRAWGGILKPRMLRAYGVASTPLYRLRRPLLTLFIWWTRLRFSRLARQVIRDIEDYRAAGITVLGVIGVDASPSCGVTTTLDLRRSFEVAATCPLIRIDRRIVNERVVSGCRVAGEGLFIRALRRRLRARGIDLPLIGFDLIAEMHGEPQRLRVPGVSSAAPSAASGIGDPQRL